MADLFPQGASIVTIGNAFGALAAYGVGIATGDAALADTAMQGLAETQQSNIDTLVFLGTMGRGGAKAGPRSGVPGDDFVPSQNVTAPYVRPSILDTTPAQKAAVQGNPCVDCGAITNRQVADHVDPLVVEYYRTGTNNIPNQRSVSAVQPHCPSCSASQGGYLSDFSKQMKNFFGF
jgi:hypothetical protein